MDEESVVRRMRVAGRALGLALVPLMSLGVWALLLAAASGLAARL